MPLMSVRKEVIPFLVAAGVFGVCLAGVLHFAGAAPRLAWGIGCGLALVAVGYFLYFFRDPERIAPSDPALILAAADGVVALIKDMREDTYLKTDTVRVSIFLSLFDVHVNRFPIAGKSRFLGYFPGKHFFTFEEKSSDFNQHNAVLITGQTRCLLYQIVGPVCRRVVYWLHPEAEVDVAAGDRMGMMKFGSRLDMYFPKAEVKIHVREGERVSAGISVIGEIQKGVSA